MRVLLGVVVLLLVSNCNDGTTEPDGGTAGGTAAGSMGGGSTAGGATAGGSTAGGSTAGGSTAGGATAGGSTAGGSTAGGSTAGGSTAGGSTAGGSTAGGSTAGGSTAGGSTAGGSTAGGSTAGGSTAGGSTAGGSTAGGSTAGGSTAGGSTAGGSTAGGSTAGGSTAGGSAAGGSAAGGSTAGGSTAGGSTAGGSTSGGSGGGGVTTVQLTVTVMGAGMGSVTSSPAGITCPGGSCSASVVPGTVVVLTATPVAGSRFSGWNGGGCTGTGTCSVAVNQATTVTATFALESYLLLVNSQGGNGNGRVVSTPAGVDCPGMACGFSFVHGSMVTLTPTASADSTFSGWSGACTGMGSCVVAMTQARNVTASFTLRTYPLSLVFAGPGAGTVNLQPSGGQCTSNCTNSYDANTMVLLVATPNVGSSFGGWTGACTGMGLSCTVTLTAAATVTATFNLQTRTVDITKLGSGSGVVVSTPAGINCGATCSSPFTFGQMVTLTGTASPGSVFLGFGGGQCSGIAPCTFMLTTNVTVTANFAPATYQLSVSRAGVGTGRVASAPVGIDCGADCSEVYTANTMVTLTATADPGSTFGGWTGGCTGPSTTCVVTMSAAASVVATFNVGTQPVTISKTGTGAGTVTSTPAGINCGPTCTASFPHGQGVTLTAAASPGSRFVGWSGACTGPSPTCVLTPTAPTTAFANFAPDTPQLTVTRSGGGAGTVTSFPAGITCGADCSEAYPFNQMVTLTAAPSPGSEFAGWTGACTGLGACVVTMNAARTVDARFDLGSYQLSVVRNGTGVGAVTSLFPGINCGADCTEVYQGNTMVTLLATPGNANMRFSGWSGGGCSGTGNCVVTLTAATTVTATFDQIMHPLTIILAGSGTGTVTSTPAGVNCGSVCTFMFPQGQNVTLTGTNGPNSQLFSWSGGGCSGFGGCTVPMSGPTTVTATFNLVNHLLSVTKTGNGAGTVTSTPTGINCGADCSEDFQANTMVTLTATQSTGSRFVQWSGACTGTSPTCIVTMSQARSVSAEFVLETHLLLVGRNGTGTGSVASSPAGISCPTTCSASFNYPTPVTLTPTAAADSDFAGWSGACTGMGPCVVTMDAAKIATATFNLRQFALTVTRNNLGGATGTVTSAPAGINCGADCTELYTIGASVVLTATVGPSSVFGGWSGDCASAGLNTTCSVSMAAARNVTVTFAELPNRMFVTSTTQTGNMGGLAGADAICRTRALAAGLTGTYVAWLSTSTVNAIDRLGAASGWIRVDGRPVFNSRADIVAGKSQYRPTVNEFGATSEDQFLHTGTAGTGIATGNLCLDWTTTTGTGVAAGRNRFSGRQWTNANTNSCAGASPIYCFGVDRQGAAYTATTTNRKAFLSSNIFNPSTGLAAADAICQADATTAGLSGTFLAMLATSTASAQSRFNLAGSPWARVDEVVMAPTPLQFFTNTYWAAGMNMLAGGGIAVSNSAAFSGALSPSALGTLGSTCGDWTSNTGSTPSGNTDDANVSGGFGSLTLSCAMSRPIYCLQQ